MPIVVANRTATLIANLALGKVESPAIANIDEASPGAVECRRFYDSIRDALLRDQVWNFAQRRAQLPADATAPLFGFAYAYTLPDDCLRANEVYGADRTKWRIEGRKILTDLPAPLQLIYNSVDVQPGEYDSLFIDQFAARLAEAIAPRLARNRALRAEAKAERQDIEQRAALADGQEGVEDDFPDGDWIRARFGIIE